MAKDISNYDDVIDSRDVIDRIEELQALTAEEMDESDTAELAALLARQEEAEGYSGGDWKYGATLIRDSYFEKYAEELADDLGMIDSKASWPLYCIDWERAARDLQMDYTSVEFDGVTYWVRS